MKDSHLKLSKHIRKKIGTAGSKKREHLKGAMYLNPGDETYPIAVNGVPNEALIMAAWRRAGLNNDSEMRAKARRAMKTHFGKDLAE
ncbi:MAG: hypothetical protein WBW71_14445 [Bacteroidota bacterium]